MAAERPANRATALKVIYNFNAIASLRSYNAALEFLSSSKHFSKDYILSVTNRFCAALAGALVNQNSNC